MFITKKHLSRRTVLRGLGAAISLPLLDAMIPARTALAKTAARPRPRMGFIYFPHGAIMDQWTPRGEGRNFELSPILEPLAPFKHQLTVISGLGNRPAESGAVHAIVPGTWLSCVHPRKGQQEPYGGVTIDQVAARFIGQDTPHPSLEIATEVPGGAGGSCDREYGCSYSGTISFRTPTTPLPMEHNPRKLFERLFGRGATPEERAQVVQQYGSLLDMVAEEAASLKRVIGPRDRAMLDDYLESVREIERRVHKVEQQDLSHLTLPEMPVGIPDSFPERLSLMLDMAALAYQANLTRIVNFMMAAEVSGTTYNHLGVSEAFHPLSHHGDDPEKKARLARVQTYHTQVFSHFLEKLDSMEEGDGTVLDNSLILFGANMSNSDRHNNDPLPSALFGKAGGSVKGGQHLAYPQDTPHANLLLTIMQRAGIPEESFGDSTGVLAEV